MELAQSTTDEARRLTDRIKVAIEGTWLLIQEAYVSRAWAVLGYDSWDAYCAEEFKGARLRLPREERQEVVASMRESGLSIRAIATATGMGIGTTARAVTASGVPGGTPEVQGIDGKTYPAARPAEPNMWFEPADDEPAQTTVADHAPIETVTPTATPKRRPLPDAFTDAALDLARTAERLGRLVDDDRWARNRDETRHRAGELLGALTQTTAALTAMDLPAAHTTEEARRWWATSLTTIGDALLGIANTL